MANTHTASATGSDHQRDVPHAAESPLQRSFRGVIRDSYEEEGGRIVKALSMDLDSTGLSDKEIEERTGVGAAQLSRIRSGQAHPPGALMAWAIEQSRIRPPALVSAVCAAAEGEFRPRPPPSVEERHAATLDVLHEMRIAEVVTRLVAERLGVKP